MEKDSPQGYQNIWQTIVQTLRLTYAQTHKILEIVIDPLKCICLLSPSSESLPGIH